MAACALETARLKVDGCLWFCASIGVWDAPFVRFWLRRDYEEDILEFPIQMR